MGISQKNIRLVLFKSIKELISNVVKHARASRLEVNLKRQANCLEITVEDDGIGFDYNPDLIKLKSDHYGLFSIEERMSDLGGAMIIDPADDTGTKVKLTIPIS